MITDSNRLAGVVPRIRRIPAAIHLGMLLLLGLIALPTVAPGATFTVNSTADMTDAKPGDGVCATAAGTCTLRAAIQESNALAGPDTINLPANTYTLTVGGAGEDAAATGDLDITDDLILNGSTTGPTTINANNLDRAFDVIGPANVTMTQLIIENGAARGEDGGAIRNDATLTVTQTAMFRNQATINGNGGAIANFNTGTLQLTNVTLNGNTTVPPNNPTAGNGGAISNLDSASVQLTNVTISGNSAAAGGGIWSLSAVQMVNSIVAGNPTGGNCSGAQINSLGYNLDDTDSCLLGGPGDLTNVGAQLGPLSDNGGYTFTQALLPGSPAIDAGNNANCPPVDQRGFPRPIDGDGNGTATCDIGAFELQPNVTPTPTPILTPTLTFTPPPTMTATTTNTVPPTNTSPPTLTSSPTKIVSATRTPTAASPTPTSLTPTSSPTATASPTNTLPPASMTLTPTPTPTPSLTPTPLGPSIVLGMGTGYPGEQVSFSATFDAQGVSVGSLQSDIGFDAANAPINALANGTPDCTISPSLSMSKFPSFTFLRSAGCRNSTTCACSGSTCTAVRAAVLSLSSPIVSLADGVLLYTCNVNIAASAAPGQYALTQNTVIMSDPLGLPISNVGGSAGAIIVLEGPTPTPSATPTTVPTDSPTPTDTVVPTNTPTPVPSSTPSVTPTASASATPTSSTPASPTPASPTPTYTVVPCVGDCDGNGEVTVNELIAMVNIALGNTPVSACPAGDADHNGEITINEILRAVNNALGSCP